MAARRPARSMSPVEWASNTAPTAASAAAATTTATTSTVGAGRDGGSRLDCPGAEGARGDADTAEGATTDPLSEVACHRHYSGRSLSGTPQNPAPAPTGLPPSLLLPPMRRCRNATGGGDDEDPGDPGGL